MYLPNGLINNTGPWVLNLESWALKKTFLNWSLILKSPLISMVKFAWGRSLPLLASMMCIGLHSQGTDLVYQTDLGPADEFGLCFLLVTDTPMTSISVSPCGWYFGELGSLLVDLGTWWMCLCLFWKSSHSPRKCFSAYLQLLFNKTEIIGGDWISTIISANNNKKLKSVEMSNKCLLTARVKDDDYKVGRMLDGREKL